ncbi:MULTISPECIES: M23 family metallopeptidase [unclassified Streptomyces]|uniref:M23 family metallopeptidase n=1 Tax=unclassified Streptomyces TaxID=2593676 RepID=UPI0006AE6424|nr:MULTISPECIES: M23 family metallopeptidase [unclassified Streptomyces]KOX18956.1 peptidase M23 [Streptomyces sp. NRRL F-6491]KOX37583.1 peptidase M23 [Streptomyces sp. NRRL F-6492]
MFTRKSAVMLHRMLWLLFFVQLIVSFTVGLPYSYALSWLPLIAALAVGVMLALHTGKEVRAEVRPPVEVDPPVTGRWSALNSPADRTPSHGTHQYGQTYAIDIVAEDEERPRPSFAWLWPVVRRSEEFPAFGAPLFAVADAAVVHAEDGLRDHLSRNSLLAVLYLLVFEATVRVLAGARWIVGNHLVLDLGDGTYAVYAHLRRGSLTVRAGDRVTAGQQVARCGNSGNSTEPHLHFHLMNGPDLDIARGVPFTWRGVGVPKNKETFEVTGNATHPA